MGNTTSKLKAGAQQNAPSTQPATDKPSDTTQLQQITTERRLSRRNRRRQLKREGRIATPNDKTALPTPPADPIRTASNGSKSPSKRRSKHKRGVHWTQTLDTRLKRAVADAERQGLITENAASERPAAWDNIAVNLRQAMPDKRRKGMNAQVARQRALWLKKREKRGMTKKSGRFIPNDSLQHNPIKPEV